MTDQLTYIHEEGIGIDHLRRFCSAAIKLRQRFAVVYPTKSRAQVLGPMDEKDNIVHIVESTRKSP